MLVRIAAIAGLALMGLMAASPAQALSSHDCSVKYKSAQDAGTLDGLKYADFRKLNCGSDATLDSPVVTSAAAPAAAPAAPSKPSAPSKPAATQQASEDPGEPNITNTEHTSEPTAPTNVAPRGVVFPKGVDAKYASESAGKARMHTCLDQYYVNKKGNALGGLKWIQKGGGYYSLCNARLKG